MFSVLSHKTFFFFAISSAWSFENVTPGGYLKQRTCYRSMVSSELHSSGPMLCCFSWLSSMHLAIESCRFYSQSFRRAFLNSCLLICLLPEHCSALAYGGSGDWTWDFEISGMRVLLYNYYVIYPGPRNSVFIFSYHQGYWWDLVPALWIHCSYRPFIFYFSFYYS